VSLALAVGFSCGGRTGLDLPPAPEAEAGPDSSPDGGPESDGPSVVDAEAGTDAAGDSALGDAADAEAGCPLGAAPRLLSPLSTAIATSSRPTLRWVAPPNGCGAASVDVCADRACTQPLGTVTVDPSGTSGSPDAALPDGPVFWRVRSPGGASATWEFFVAGAAGRDASHGSVPDFDGDGHPDLAVGQMGYEGSVGAANVYRGSASGISAGSLTSFPSPQVGPWTDWRVTTGGDLDGDGFGDLVRADINVTPGSPTMDLVRIDFGGAQGVDVARELVIEPPDMAQFGRTIVAAGDVDGDGYADLMVTSYPSTTEAPLGAAYLYRGGPGGPASTPIEVAKDTAQFGLGSTACDVDGDGRPELMVNAGSVPGVFVYKWTGSTFSQLELIPGDTSGDFGWDLATGDFDGDGHCDLLAGSGESAVKLFLGVAGGFQTTPAQTFTTALGTLPASAGDVDGDGSDDILIGAEFAGPFSPTLIFGRTWTMLPLPMFDEEDTVPVAGVGDLDGDGHYDVAVGEPSADAVMLYSGAALQQGAVQPWTTLTRMSGYSLFGYSIGRL